MRMRPRVCLLLALAVLAGCAITTRGNYDSPAGPRYAGGPESARAGARTDTDTLRIVSFNIAWAHHLDSAIAALRADASARDADVVLLQEMDEPGTKRVAGALGMHYVYYPATLHPRTKRDFGNAVLSRWPIVADSKVVLPHVSRFRQTLRTATGATIKVGDTLVRVYSAHLGTVADVLPGERREQLRAILDDAARFDRVIIGGDMNDPNIGEMARATGYTWPTRTGPRTALVGRLDHIFLKGLASPHTGAAGIVRDNRNASDHHPIWAVAVLR